jgi:drug/metabolite transporter (DMT)-like permease
MDATLLENTISLFIPLTAWIWLRQRISASSWLLLLLGFFAVLLILKPQFDILCFATFAPLGCALLSAISGVAVTSLSRTDHLLTILFYFHLWGLGLAFIPLCLFWQGTFSMPESYTFIFLGSLIGVSFQYVMNKAFTLLSPHIVANFTYFNVLFSALLGWLIWQEVMNGMQLLGGALLIGVGLLVRRQTQLKPKEEIDLAS